MLRIIHFSDLHLARPLGSFCGMFDKRLFGYLNGQVFRKHAYREERIPRIVDAVLTEMPDLVIFTGDATTCSQPEEFEAALQYLKPLKEAGLPILYLPGNHDRYVSAKKCADALGQFQFELTGRNAFPYTYETPDCTFVLFDSARATNPILSCGWFSKESADFLKNLCRKKKKPIIAISHFPVLTENKGFSMARRGLRGAGCIRELLSHGELDLLLCGHVHKPYEKLDWTGRGEACAGSLTKTGKYRLITFADGMFHFEERSV